MKTGINCALKCGCGRSGSWSPAQLPDLAAWYEAGPEYCWQDAGCTVACGDGDPIYTWQDRSGNGYNLTQTDPLKRPTLRLVNGKWCVRFDGVNDCMTTANFSTPGEQNTKTVAIAGCMTAGSNSFVIGRGSSDDNEEFILAFIYGSLTGFFDVGDYVGPYIQPAGAVFDTYATWVASQLTSGGSTALYLRQNNVPLSGGVIAPAHPPNAISSQPLRIGNIRGLFPISGDLACVIYSAEYSGSDLASTLHTYLASKIP